MPDELWELIAGISAVAVLALSWIWGYQYDDARYKLGTAMEIITTARRALEKGENNQQVMYWRLRQLQSVGRRTANARRYGGKR